MSRKSWGLVGTAVAVLCSASLLGATLAHSAADVTVRVNGREIASDVPARIENGRTLVPLRFVAEALGAQVAYDEATRTVNVDLPIDKAVAAGGVRGVVRQAQPSVVGILNRMADGSTAAGSGVVLDTAGHVLTNHHVIEEARTLQVVVRGRLISATLAGSDKEADLAVLKIDPAALQQAGLKPASWGDSDAMEAGDLVVALGNPLGFQYQSSVTMGIVSGLRRSVSDSGYPYTLIQTDAAINQGNSGGPLVNAAGEVIGINTLKLVEDGVESLGFAIPSKIARTVARQLIERGRFERPYLGITVKEADGVGKGLLLSEGVTLSDVAAGSPADRAGLRAGDVILGLAGQEVNSFADLRTALDVHPIGGRISARIKRGNNTFETMVELTRRP